MSAFEEAQRILILDLGSQNPISERSIEPYLPASKDRRAYRVSDFGAEPAAEGTPPRSDKRRWKAWTEAIERMLAQVREDLGVDLGEDLERVHYYVAGRAALPVFAYLGARLSKFARVTVINKRPGGTWDVMPLQAAAAPQDGPRFFDVVRGLDQVAGYRSGKVAVFVSTQNSLEERKVVDFVRAHGSEVAGIVEIRAQPAGGAALDPRKWLGQDTSARAAAELEGLFTALKNQYQDHEGLAVFVAGPAPLAMMVGRAINPRIYTPVWLPNYRDGDYEPAIEIPWPVARGKLRILTAVANVPGEGGARLDTDEELRNLLDQLEPHGGKPCFEHKHRPAVRLEDLMDWTLDFQPHILHFSGHGDAGGTYLMRGEGEDGFVWADGFVGVLRQTSECLRLVVLCSCRSSRQAQALAAFVDCAVGTTAKVDDTAAIRFSRGFYGALRRGLPVQRAFDLGRALVRAELGPDADVFELHPRPGVEPTELVLFSPGTSRA